MSQGFYEQMGVPIDADADQIRAAYGRAVAHLMRRRDATVAQGGDPSALDLARAQIDDAWQALSDPARRRRYDAMLAVAGDGSPRGDLDALWARVAGAMVHPSVAAAARFVDATTQLQLGALPEPPRPPGARSGGAGWEEEVTITARVQATLRDSFGPRRVSGRGTGVAEPPAAPEPPITAPAGATAARVTSPRAEPAEVVARVPAPPVSEAQRLFDELGPTGAMLRAVREAKGMSLAHVAEVTRISSRYLEAIEAEDYASLPSAAAFVRGYVREMARLLDLEVERVVSGYMRRFTGDG